MAREDLVILQNFNKTKTEVFSADGDSIHLMPDTKTGVESKYLWNLPKGVRQYKEDYTVFGKKTRSVDTTAKSGNLITPDKDRPVLDTNEDTKAVDASKK